MSSDDPIDAFRVAIARLAELESAVARQQSYDQVAQALAQLQLAVVRSYGGRQSRPAGVGARKKILAHLEQHVGEWVLGEELAAVSGIGEWARRIRELRVEEGYEIEEESGLYRLSSLEPNRERRDHWRAVSDARKMEGTALQRVSALFECLPGTVLAEDELDRAAKSKGGGAIARQLREAELWPIESSADARDLSPGEYRLASANESDQLNKAQGLFAEQVRGPVFLRDRFTCWDCRLDRATAEEKDQVPFFLLIRHLDATDDEVVHLPAARLSDPTRLATICNRCAAARGAAPLEIHPPRDT